MLLVILYLIYIVLIRLFASPFFDVILVLLIGFEIFATVYRKKLDDEKKKNFKFLKRIISIVLWIALIAAGVLVNIFAGPIRFM